MRTLLNSCWTAVVALSLLAPRSAWALDSYRYLHVTIETPWYIFLFLLPLVLSPLIFIVVLYWYFSLKRRDEGRETRPSESTKAK